MGETVKIPLMDFIDLIETSVRYELFQKQLLDVMVNDRGKPFFIADDVLRILKAFCGDAVDERFRKLVNEGARGK